MIKKLHIKNYKILKDNAFEFSNLNVFTGLNGMGKSSVIQSLLLLRQSFQGGNLSQNQGLQLKVDNFGYIDVGNADDAFSQTAETTEQLSFEVTWEQTVNFCFDYLRENDVNSIEIEQIKNASNLRNHSQTAYPNEIFKQASLFKSDNFFQYLNAEREGPRKQNETSSHWVTSRREFDPYGKYALHYLEQYKNELVANEGVKHPDAQSDILEHQVNAWLSEITPGTKLKTTYFPQSQSVEGTFDVGAGTSFRPTNVGFGLTYVLPVILALLTTKEDGMVIIENPESHLNPSGQAKMAELIARCAASGRQVFIETHSDHIVNGIRIQIFENFKGNQGIDQELVKIYYLNKEQDQDDLKVNLIELSDTGRIKENPRGFFDQFQIDLKRMIK